jgi:HSP20 family protein
MFGRFSSAIDTLLAMQEAMDSTMKSDYFEMATTSRGSYPPINIFQEGENTVLMAEIPGVKKDDIRVEIKGNLIRLSGHRKIDYPEKSSVHRLERMDKKFDRTVKLPFSVDIEKVKAEFKDGILNVVLPMLQSDKPELIQVA